MKHILIIETDIPDPEFSVIARTKDTLDGFEAVDHREMILPMEKEIREAVNDFYDTPGYQGSFHNSIFYEGVTWTLKRLGL